MNRRRAVGALCFLLAFAFAANTLWLAPHGNDTRYEYQTVPVNDSNAEHFLWMTPSVENCAPGDSRTCRFEYAARNGGVTVDADFGDSYGRYEYVLTRDGLYRPKFEIRNGTTILTSRHVSTAAVLASVSYEPWSGVSDMDSSLQNAIQNGHLTTRSDIPPSHRLLNKNGTYYYLQATESGSPHPLIGPYLFAIRVLLWLATVPLSVLGVVYWYD